MALGILLIILLVVGAPLLVLAIVLIVTKTARGAKVPDQVWPAAQAPGAATDVEPGSTWAPGTHPDAPDGTPPGPS